MAQKLSLAFKKETPGTVVFEDKTDNAPIGTIYVRKSAFAGGKAPKKLTVTVAELG